MRSFELIEKITPGIEINVSGGAAACDVLTGVAATPATQSPERSGLIICNSDATDLYGKLIDADQTAPTIAATDKEFVFKQDTTYIVKCGANTRLWVRFADGVAGIWNAKEYF